LVFSLATIVLAVSSFATSSGAQDFYRGKSVTLFAGQPPGGGIDSEMRLVGQFLEAYSGRAVKAAQPAGAASSAITFGVAGVVSHWAC
jgi:tripartite-type tricarboxylate transporter receptor subunit TctC